jgi:hypothetical protein
MTRRARFFAAIVVFASFALSLVVCELVFRAVAPEWSDQWKMWRPDPVHAHGLQLNVRDAVVHGLSGEFAFRFSTNRQGLRMGYDLAIPKPAGRERILLVGDSFTFGYGVEQDETFAARLQERLDPTRARVEVINAGFASGFTLDTHYVFLREVGAAWGPNRTIAGICLSNDFDDLAKTKWSVAEGKLASVVKLTEFIPTWLSENLPMWVKSSALLNFARSGLLAQWRARSSEPGPAPNLVEACALDDELYRAPTHPVRASVKPQALDKQSASWPAAQRADWVARSWSAHAHEKGYRLSFLFIPDRQEVQGMAAEPTIRHMLEVRKVFSNAASAAGIEILDPTLDMRARWCATRQPLYFEIDGHWNANGHRFIADWLATRSVFLSRH